jgi:hypothetical protein
MTDKTAPAANRAPPVPDTTALKALAHADRLRMLGLLRFDGPSTATALAKRLGMNSGATSYHLRQLARYGFIEPVPERGTKRERWWQARQSAGADDPAALNGEALEAGLAMVQAVLSQHAALMQQALEAFPALPPQWRRASNASDYVVAMTPEQAFALKERLTALLWEEVRKSPPSMPLPPGQRRFMVMLHTFPVPSGSAGQGWTRALSEDGEGGD